MARNGKIMKNGLSVSTRRPNNDVVGCKRIEIEWGEHLLSSAGCPPAYPSQPWIFTALVLDPFQWNFWLGLVEGEGCYFSNNLRFDGIHVLYKGCNIGLFDSSLPLIRIPYASGHCGGLFLFLQSVSQPPFLFLEEPCTGGWVVGDAKEALGSCLQESYNLTLEIRPNIQKAEIKLQGYRGGKFGEERTKCWEVASGKGEN